MVKIPNRFENLYPSGAIEKVLEALQQPDISGKVKDALEKVGLRDTNPLEQVQSVWTQAKDWVESAFESNPDSGNPSLLNATGQLFHDRFSHVPAQRAVVRAYSRAASSFHDASVLHKQTSGALNAALGGNATCMERSLVSAVTNVIGERQVLVAKADLLRIAGAADVSELLGNQQRIEVGAVNGCAAADWLESMEGATGDCCILLVSPGARTSAEQTQYRQDAQSVASEKGIPIYELLFDATLNAELADTHGFSNPVERIAAGIDCVVFPLNLLIAGLPGVAIAGSDTKQLTRLQRNAQLKGTAMEGAEYMAAGIALQLASEDPRPGEVPAQLLINTENLKNRAERMAALINDNGIFESAQVVQQSVPLGPSPWNQTQLENWVVEAIPTSENGKLNTSASEICEKLSHGEFQPDQPVASASAEIASDSASPVDAAMDDSSEAVDAEGSTESTGAVSTRILAKSENSKVLIDLRFVEPKDDHRIVVALSPSPFDN